MKVKRLKLLSPLFILAFVLALVMVAPPLASPAEAATPELYYDDGTPYDYIGGCQACSRYQGVRFSLPEGVTSANVTAVRFYYNYSGNVTIHITDSDHETDLITPIAYYVNETGWCDVDVSGVTVSDDFYVVIRRWEQGRNPAYDDDSNCGRSFYGSTLGGLTNLMPGNLLIRAVISFANPAQWHVSTTGSDTEGDGSLGNPWRTIQYAVDNAGVSNGDTIIVHTGTYTENVNVYKELTIQAATGENVTVQAFDPNDHVFRVTADYVTISGLTVTNATGLDEAGIYLGPGTEHCTITNNTADGNYSGIRLDSSNNNTISGNTVSDSEGCGIWLSWQDSGNTISGNTAADNDNGICLYRASNNTLSGNNATGNDLYGIYLLESNNNTLSGNTASDNYDGIHLSASSGNTIENNTVSNNPHGIYLISSSNNNTISGNTLQSNAWYGIVLWSSSNENTVINNNVSDSNRGVCFGYSQENTVANNTISDCDHGVEFQQPSRHNTIENNTIDGGTIGVYIGVDSGDYRFNKILTNVISNNTQYGIYVPSWTNNALVANNEISNNEHGVWIEGDSNLILGNDISNNSGSEDSGIHFTADASGNVAHFNNIVGNSPQGSDSYGVYNQNTTETVDATLNWWGAASGPSGIGSGAGDAVSDNVTFAPWLSVSVAGGIAEDITGAQTGVEISGPTGSDTTLTVTTSGNVTVVVALYSGNPHPEEPFPDIALGKYIDIYASDPDAIEWPVYVEMSYTEDEVAAAGIDESTLGLYYWDASANEFQRCEDTGVDTASNIIWANVDEDEAGRLAGTPFAPGGAAPEAAGGLSGGAIAGIIIGAIAGAVLIFFAVRKWVWKS